MKINKNKRGATLVELIVFLGLLTIGSGIIFVLVCVCKILYRFAFGG